jgi:hypothetical protein
MGIHLKFPLDLRIRMKTDAGNQHRPYVDAKNGTPFWQILQPGCWNICLLPEGAGCHPLARRGGGEQGEFGHPPLPPLESTTEVRMVGGGGGYNDHSSFPTHASSSTVSPNRKFC